MISPLTSQYNHHQNHQPTTMVKAHSPIAHCKIPLEVITPSKIAPIDELPVKTRRLRVTKSKQKQVTNDTNSAIIDVGRKKRVRFRSSVTVKEIRHRNDMSKDTFERIWLTESDFFLIKSQIRMTVRRMMSGKSNEDLDSDTFCPRGLECKTREGSKSRKANKIAVRQAVLREQASQREDGTSDENFIAAVSMAKSQPSIREARRVASQDEEDAVECLSEC